jgi:hypothetical protein
MAPWHWGEHGEVVAETCPAIVPPDATGWGELYSQLYSSVNLPDVRKGFTDDYGDQAISLFTCYNQTPDAQCMSIVRATLGDAAAQVATDPNYHFFFHEGICDVDEFGDGNTIAGGSDPNCDYDVLPADWTPASGTPPISGRVQDGIRFSDWAHALISPDGSYANPVTGMTTVLGSVK